MSDRGAPKISVLLPVWNGQEYLRDAVDSILAQSFTDFELIAINDGSTDATADILESYKDARLRVMHQANAGLAVTLNRGVELARGTYVARQDADDISRPERFAAQSAYLDAHPECGLLGSWSSIWEGNTPTARGHFHPQHNGTLQVMSLLDSYFVHSAVMARRHVMLQAGNYPVAPERNPPEDFDLWSRMSRICALGNVPRPLVVYREVPNSISREKADLIRGRGHRLACENLSFLLGPAVNRELIADFAAALRHDPARLSDKPDWHAMTDLLRDVEQRIAQRFPAEQMRIAEACKDLRGRLRRTRLLRHPVVNRLVRWRRALRG